MSVVYNHTGNSIAVNDQQKGYPRSGIVVSNSKICTSCLWTGLSSSLSSSCLVVQQVDERNWIAMSSAVDIMRRKDV